MLTKNRPKTHKRNPKPEQAGPKLNRAYYPAWNAYKRYQIMMGGGGSGKSVFCVQKILHRCKWEHSTKNSHGDWIPYTFSHRFLVLRKVANTRKNSVYKLFKDEIARQGLNEEWRAYDGDMRLLHIPTGAEILTAGIDDPEKIKSIAGITSMWLEEATEFMEADFLQLDLRLRGETPYYKQILISFNPITKGHWLCQYFDTIGGKYTNPLKTDLFVTTYRHNSFLDAEYIEALENLVNVDENLFRIYVLGQWGIEDPNKLFAKHFKPDVHVSNRAVYNPNLGMVWLAFDFNVVNTCLVFQYTDSYIHCIKEYRYEAGDLQDLAAEIRTDLRQWKCAALGIPEHLYIEDIITINGDASGGNKSGLTVDRMSAYEQLAQFFGHPSGGPLDWEYFNVPKANPAHGASRMVSNMVLKNERQFYIHPSCKVLIRDLEEVKFVDGKIDKSDESLTHALDAWRYFVWAELKERLKSYGLAPVMEKIKGGTIATA